MIGWWRRRGRSWFCFRSSFVLPAKSTLLKLSSRLSPRAKGNGNGLVVLYKDMESCGEYADIRVLWEMVQSSRSLNSRTSRRRVTRSFWKFCFSGQITEKEKEPNFHPYKDQMQLCGARLLS